MDQIIFREIRSNDQKTIVAIFSFSGPGDPVQALDEAVRKYVGSNPFNEYIDANLDNPWIRIVISGINDLDQINFDSSKHHL